jgi:stage II sporulation protein D
MPIRHIDPPLVRVLLHRGSGAIELPQPGRLYRASGGGGGVWLWGPLRIMPHEGSLWQVAALSDAATATAVSQRLAGQLADRAQVIRSTTRAGLGRIRVRWHEPEPPDPAAELSLLGFNEAFPVREAGLVRIEPATGAVFETAGEVVLEPQGRWPTAVDGRRYHGRFLLRSAGADLLVINQLNLEVYLKGVVPVEMGPAQFPELEALKAQTVAARTYAVAHLGDHDAEGYDLCDTAACQVYRGADVHHPLSDRAVEETAGIFAVFDGMPIDAMYTSTCGGHTESAELLFSGRAQPYLQGVPCAWDRPMILQGSGGGASYDGEGSFRTHLATLALGLSAAASLQDVIDKTAVLCQGRAERLGAEPGIAEFAEGLLTAGGLEGTTAITSREGAGRIVELADLFEIPLDLAPAGGWRSGWQLRAALAVLELQGVVRRDRGEAVPHPDGVAIFPRGGARSEELPNPLPLYWRWASNYGSAQAVKVLPGTMLDRYRIGDQTLAVVVVQSGGAGEADRRSAWRSWTRDREWRELARRLEIPDLERLEVSRRGPSGRIIGLIAEGSSGTRKDLQGFPIRRALDLPENLVSFHIMSRPDGTRVVRFLGRAWGHGVGLCQNGAYGLARAGMSFDRILRHYYTGIELARWQPQ